MDNLTARESHRQAAHRDAEAREAAKLVQFGNLAVATIKNLDPDFDFDHDGYLDELGAQYEGGASPADAAIEVVAIYGSKAGA